MSRRSPAEDAADDSDSPDTDLRSSVSPPLGGEEEMKTRDSRDIERSSGESENEVIRGSPQGAFTLQLRLPYILKAVYIRGIKTKY